MRRSTTWIWTLGSRALAACSAATAFLLGLAPCTPVAAAEPISLEGTWYVLVHYRDADAANADALRWEDRVWVFARKGSRLQWTDYPIVVFNDESGRFERGRAGSQRVVGAWEPNPGQREQITQGLEINTRGSKKKSLSGSDDKGWKSLSSGGVSSASVVGYSETWEIGGVAEGLPEFTRSDVLGSVRAEPYDGRTVWKTTEAADGGSLLTGTYARDEAKRGTFRAMRAGEVQSVGTKKTQQERQREIMQGEGAQQP